MTKFTLEHKYCGAIHVVYGYDVYSAMRANGLDSKAWQLIDAE